MHFKTLPEDRPTRQEVERDEREMYGPPLEPTPEQAAAIRSCFEEAGVRFDDPAEDRVF